MKEGDFLRVEYIGRVSGTNEIFDLTSEEIARREGIHNPNYKYGPVLVIIGAGMIIPGVEKKLRGMKPGDEKEFDVSPEDGFGKRDVRGIKIISLANFIRSKITPVPGAFVTINNRQARIQSVSGGRVRVDFNHPLAGKELHYRVKIAGVIRKPMEKVKAIVDYYRLECELELKNGILHVKAKEPQKNIVKKLLTNAMTKWVKEVKKVNFSGESGQKSETKGGEKQEKGT